MKPISPYGISKTASQHLAEVYREAYGLPVSTGILFNHESELRAPTYFSGKAVSGVVDIYLGAATEIQLQSLNFSRDWSYAEDVAQAMHLISSLEEAFTYLGLDEDWERFLTQSSGETRPLDHQGKVGNFKKLNLATGWVPKTEFSKMIAKMIDWELKRRSR
jgi:GDPmannose 4,6-dehydratase